MLVVCLNSVTVFTAAIFRDQTVKTRLVDQMKKKTSERHGEFALIADMF